DAVGLRQPAARSPAPTIARDGGPRSATRPSQARLVSFRDEDGRFRQRLFDVDGTELLLSEPFEDPRALNRAGRSWVGRDLSTVAEDDAGQVILRTDSQCWARFPAALRDRVQAALKAL